MSSRFNLNAPEIRVILHASDYVNQDLAFDLTTEAGTKDAARYRMAIQKLRAKLKRVEREIASHD